MEFFKFFSNKKENNAILTPLSVAEPVEPASDQVINETVPVESGANAEKPLTISYATGWPIDIIYGYLHKNYEQRGFDDAMVKSDLTYRDMNMNIIKNKILIVFREINLNYDVMKHDIETRIETCSAAGLLSTVADMEKTMTIINTHKEELKQLEHDFRSNENEASVPLQSYECGFLRGIATIATSNVHNIENIPQKPSVAPTLNKSIA